jgi:hypothetical protein
VLSFVGLSIIWSQGRTLPIGICLLFILVLFILRYFHLVNTWGDFRKKFDRVLGRRREVQYALLQAQVLELELERCPTGAEFWPIFHLTMRRVGFVEPGEECDVSRLEVRSQVSASFILHAPRDSTSVGEWLRMAECFRPIYEKALLKWPR